MTKVRIVREDADPLVDVRISLGMPVDFDGFYLVFRGEPEKVINLLEKALATARVALPEKNFHDHRRVQL